MKQIVSIAIIALLSTSQATKLQGRYIDALGIAPVTDSSGIYNLEANNIGDDKFERYKMFEEKRMAGLDSYDNHGGKIDFVEESEYYKKAAPQPPKQVIQAPTPPAPKQEVKPVQ